MTGGIAAIIKDDNKILLIQENRELLHGLWAPPHGCLEENESEEDGVVREVQEEVGITVRPVKRLYSHKADTKVDTVYFWEAEYLGGYICPDPVEVAAWGWFTVDEAKKLDLYPATKFFFEKYGGSLND